MAPYKAESFRRDCYRCRWIVSEPLDWGSNFGDVGVVISYEVSLLDNEAIVEKRRKGGGGRREGREVWG